jgi:glycyl-tRNA synthetase beta chain
VADFLLELGTEEIPAKFLARALEELPKLAKVRLDDARLAYTSLRAMGTPRRIALEVRGLADRQPDLRERVVGPPASAAFDKAGAPTKAAIGFAQKNGVDPATLEKAEVEGKKGQYVVATRHVVGRDAAEVLPPLVIDLIAAIPWPKSMRWGWTEQAFVRPVHWMVCLLGEQVLPVRWGALIAGRASRGHRFLATAPVEIPSPAAYVETMRHAHVIVDVDARRDTIVAELRRIEGETGLRVRPDAGLLAEVTNLVEYPVAVAGSFDPAFLEVPEEVIVTAMRTHQRYFALEDAAGTLAPRFVTIAGTVTRDVHVVAAGNQKVIASRLSDAKFFFREDRKKPLEDFGKTLDDVVFQAKLGTVGAKIRRIGANAGGIAVDHLRIDPKPVERAAALAKADLATGVVGEFPELQGVMGSHYARLGGEPEPVWRAIADHYRPRGASDDPPETLIGAVVGIADRIDTIVGCFAVDLEPTGSPDPFGLRRAAIGILATLLHRGKDLPVRIEALIARAAHHLRADKIDVTDTDLGEVREFFRGRLRGLLIDEGIAAQDVDAALGAGWDDPVDARIRARDLAVVPREAREVFKRIANILDDAGGKGIAISGNVRESDFVAPDNVEWKLWRAFQQIEQRLDEAVRAQEYRRVFGLLVELQPAVAAFFDRGGVMVMDPEERLRDNRLSLLQRVLAPFARVADFRALAVQS